MCKISKLRHSVFILSNLCVNLNYSANQFKLFELKIDIWLMKHLYCFFIITFAIQVGSAEADLVCKVLYFLFKNIYVYIFIYNIKKQLILIRLLIFDALCISSERNKQQSKIFKESHKKTHCDVSAYFKNNLCTS